MFNKDKKDMTESERYLSSTKKEQENMVIAFMEGLDHDDPRKDWSANEVAEAFASDTLDKY